jgi:glycosyltransferase involved in cell wall biosynthesis
MAQPVRIINILFNNYLKAPGGVANYVEALINHLDSERFCAKTLKIHYERLDHRHNGSGLPKKKGGFSRRWHRLRLFLAYGRILESEKIDIVHSNPSLLPGSIIREALFICSAKRYRRKILVFFRGWNEDFENLLVKNRAIFSLFRRVYNKSDVFIVLGSEFKSKMISWGFKQPIFVETTTVDDLLLKDFDLDKRLSDFTSRKTIQILFLSRIEREKGIFETIDAFDSLSKKYPVKLYVAGNGSALRSCREYTEKKNISEVSFAGHVEGPDKIDVFRKSDIYCFPTYHGEGMPNSVLEAMGFGLPVVTRAVGGICDFFKDGLHGFLVDGTDSQEISKCLERLISNRPLCAEISRRNHNYAADTFITSKVARRIEKIYEMLFYGKADEIQNNK